ncbi:hypothetical protein H8N03_21740 [Ramlibacter sp. USB13]|uniref:TonB-dependent receptor n=2 Tax=Ramlibacter cellulosilyticus TaxID=2764187 RepID=A0A923SDQ4_9BURK|nr:hypothetical protein [Ramlibacter cellulosilyticus]
MLCLAAGSAAAQPASPSSPSDTQALRRELDAMRAEYEQRIRALEQRLQAAEAKAATQPPASVPTPAPASAVAAAPAAAPSTAGRSLLDISMILSGQYTSTQLDPSTYRIRGFPLPTDAEAGPGTRGFSLSETELTLGANIDPYFRGQATFAVTPENEIEVEEAYVQTTALGRGLTVKAGRFFSSIGYLNSQHRHTWDFADAPLAYQAMLGGQFGDDGLQLAWVAPTDRFLELRAEVGRGRSFPGSDTSRNGLGAAALSAHVGDDIGDSHSWRAGLSYLQAKATDQELAETDTAGNAITNTFTGRTKVWIADAVYRWAPNGNPKVRNFKLQGEYLQARRDGDLVVDSEGAASPGTYAAKQSGWYLQGVYQFMPRWRAGLRTERLSPGTPDFGVNAGLVDLGSGTPRRNTLMLEHNPSEFSRVRLQVAQDRARGNGGSDLQWWLQYQMSLGAHGAHGF